MNWIILIFAGLCEVGFTYCLGRAKGVAGYEWWTWISGFAVFYVLSAILLACAKIMEKQTAVTTPTVSNPLFQSEAVCDGGGRCV